MPAQLYFRAGVERVTRNRFNWLGHTNSHHDLAHDNAMKEMTEINTWFSSQLAYVMGVLDQ
jgi:hypothetical protein